MTLEPRDDEFDSITGSCSFVLSFPLLMITFLILIGVHIGFNGFGGVVVSLIVTAIAALFGALLIAGIASAMMGGRSSPPAVTSGTPHPPAGLSPGLATDDAAPEMKTPASSASDPTPPPSRCPTPALNRKSHGWRPHLRTHEPDVDRGLRDIELMVRERPEFTGAQQEKALDAVARFSRHHSQQQHILENPSHPDHSMVTREMNRYRRTVLKLLHLRQEELAAGTYGGFDYREDLRAAEGMVEVLKDEFEQLTHDTDPHNTQAHEGPSPQETS